FDERQSVTGISKYLSSAVRITNRTRLVDQDHPSNSALEFRAKQVRNLIEGITLAAVGRHDNRDPLCLRLRCGNTSPTRATSRPAHTAHKARVPFERAVVAQIDPEPVHPVRA